MLPVAAAVSLVWTVFADANIEALNSSRPMNPLRRSLTLSLAFLAAVIAAEPPSFPDLSAYDFSDNRSWHWLRPHRENGVGARHTTEPLLAMTTFHAEMALEYFTFEVPEVKNYSHRNTGMAMQNTQGRQLKAEDIPRLKGLFKELPATNSLPARHRLVLLSYRDGTNWITRAFDNGDRPKALQEIFWVIGERWDEYGKPPPR